MKQIMKITIVSLSLMWVMHTLAKNFMVDPTFESFLSRKDQQVVNEALWIWMIRIHILLAIMSLITGPLGMIKKLRVKSMTFHRWNGRIYVLSIILNFIPGVYVSFYATGGWPSTIGFLILNTLWLMSTISSYIYVKKQNILLHAQWMIRSFFLSFANMTIYIIVAIGHHLLDLSYAISYTIAVWLCWVLNLLLAELFVRKKTFL